MLNKLRKYWVNSPLAIFAVLSIQILQLIPAQAAGTVVFSGLGITCNQHTANDIYAHRYVAGTTGLISAINVLLPASAVSNPTFRANFPSATYLLMANNGSSGPTTTLATFTSDTMTGTNARFTGSYSITAGTKFWVVAGQGAAVFPDCYGYPGAVPNASVTFTNGWRLDTATSTTWPFATGATPTSLGAVTNNTWLFALSIEISPPAAASVAINLQSGGLSASYKSATPIQATTSTDGRVTFYQSGKIIPGCRKILTSSMVASCTWKPNVHGAVRLTASVTPTDISIPSGGSNAFFVGVIARSNNR